MYLVTDKFDYTTPAKWSFSKNERNTLDTKAKYDYYFRDDTIVCIQSDV